MLLFALDGSLLPLTVSGPALVPLLKLPPLAHARGSDHYMHPERSDEPIGLELLSYHPGDARFDAVSVEVGNIPGQVARS